MNFGGHSMQHTYDIWLYMYNIRLLSSNIHMFERTYILFVLEISYALYLSTHIAY